jgi:serine protease inhibitor
VNTWVEKLTSGLIKEILPKGSIESTTRIVLGNALTSKDPGNLIWNFHTIATESYRRNLITSIKLKLLMVL